jgi:hypothetical protein
MKRKLIYKFPSRNRPDKFKHVLEKSISLLSGKHDVRFVITLDSDDETMNNDNMREWMDNLNVDLVYHYGDSKSKIEACNANLEDEDGDALILVSDDMVPCFQDFDDIIMQGMEQFFPDMDGAIKFHDGLRPKEDLLMTLPVLGWNLYKKFGYIYHPDYTSLYCDNEMTIVCRDLGKLLVSPVCIFRHEWTNQPFDDLHARNENSEMYAIDSKVFEERQKNRFDIDKLVKG